MRILIVEDDRKLSKVMKQQLAAQGYEADICDDGGDVAYFMSHGNSDGNVYDLMILDRMLPAVDGLSVLNDLRKKGCTAPVIMVTALGTLDNRIEGLDGGADDYLIKPFAMEELSARIRALLRRPPELIEPEHLHFSDLNLNGESRILSCGDNSCELSKKERELMEYLLKNPELTIARDVLITRVWGAESEISDGNLDNYISFLRRRLRTLQSRVQIKTVHATGYRLEEARHEEK